MTISVKTRDLVCVTGRGAGIPFHAHYLVKRVSKTMFTVARTVNGREVTRRYRFDGREVGSSEYTGTVAATTCQRPERKS